MSSISAVAGSNPAWSAQAAQPVKPVDRDGDNDSNKPETAQEAAKDKGGAATRMLDIKA